MKKIFILMTLILSSIQLFSQNNCSVNAGGNANICGTTFTLQGTTTGTTGGNPTWTIVSKPSGATDPVISNPNILTPNVTGINSPGNYVFQVSQPCGTGTATSQVTITAPGSVSAFTAGPDITGISAITGVANLNATIPAGYTASWTYYNIYNYETFGGINQTNATMSNTTTATPTLTLTNKANHTIDPAYRAVLRITSINNPNCWYEDDAIVRFIPNPDMLFPATTSQCVTPGTTGANFFYDPTGASPRLATTTANSSGNPAFGTTVSMAVVSQPAGGNMQYSRIENGRLYFSGITATGDYIFDLTISNSLGSFTKRLTYTFRGYQPGFLDFIDPAYPNQMEIYSSVGTAGSVYCNMVGSSAPITFNFQINAADPPTTTTTVTSSGVIPGGAAVSSIVETGAGTMNRSVTLTPPPGGWRAGTYRFSIKVESAGGCSRTPIYYVHISDNARPAVNVDNITVCYPGSGVVTATVPLPAIYKTTAANPSYFQDFPGRYDFTLVSSPAGAATPTYEVAANRSFTSTSTIISNLDKPGEYVFKIKSAAGSAAQGFIDAEYACSGTSAEDTFSIFVSAEVGANAGSDLSLIGVSETNLNGNNPGAATGTWTLAAKPSGAPDPVIVDPSAFDTNVTGLDQEGTYSFKWTVATGTCINEDTMDVTIAAQCSNSTPTIFYNADNAGNPYGNTGGTGNLLPFVTASNIAGGTYYKTTGTETLNGVRPKSGSTLFSMSGITNAVQTSKYYSFNVTTAANSPVLYFHRFSAIAMDVDLVLSPGGMPNVSYNLRVAIVDSDLGTEINLGSVYINSVNPVNLNVDYVLQPGKTYQIKLYPWNTNGRTNVYLDNPRIYFNPVPATGEITIVCNTNVSGTVGSALAPYLTSSTPSGLQLKWLNNGIDVTNSPIGTGIYTPIYYNSVTDCYSETGNSVTVITCTGGPGLCTKPGATGDPLTSSVGILTKGEPSVAGWPEVVPNGYLVLDGAFKGMVITHMTTAQINALTPVEGMLVFDTNESCVKLYRGTTPSVDGSGAGWVCIQRGCNE